MRANGRDRLALAIGVAVFAAVVACGRERANAMDRPRLTIPLRAAFVAHLPDRVRTFARVDVARLRCGRACGVATRRVTSPASLAHIAASLARVRTHPARGGFDARWSVTATGADGKVLTFACDRFGRVGTFDGRSVALSRASPLLATLRRELPAGER